MAKKSHFFFRNPEQLAERFRYTGRNPNGNEEDDEPEPEPNYRLMVASFRTSLRSFREDATRRVAERTQQVPAHVTHIDIEFFNTFDVKSFEAYYRNNFGLSATAYYDLNRRATFAVNNQPAFEHFFNEISTFIRTNGNVEREPYDPRIKYIKSFQYLTTERILADLNPARNITYLNVIDNPDLFIAAINPIQTALNIYLDQQQIAHSFDEATQTLELKSATQAQVTEIIKNYDIIRSVVSSSVRTIRPTVLGEPVTDHVFTVSAAEDGLPVVGVIDSGISDQTVLAPLIINTNGDYDLYGGNGKTDNADHGTAVGAFVSLGKQILTPTGALQPEAKLLSIKILDGVSGNITVSQVTNLIEKAAREQRVRIFTLTVNFSDGIKSNAAISKYALGLDKLAYALDLLIFISVGNNYTRPDNNYFDVAEVNAYPNHFLHEDSNLTAPADSMNNLSVGAIGDNFEAARLESILDNSLPGLYTRRYHIDDTQLKHKNPRLFKPDLLFGGGNLELNGTLLEHQSESAMLVLSSNPANSFLREIGTSFATPLVANLAVKILNLYPALRLQTVKAMIVNSCKEIELDDRFNNFTNANIRAVSGNGCPEETRCLYSNENEVTFILEGEIEPKQLKSYTLTIPPYLSTMDTNPGLLEITATLTFKFEPEPNNQIAYCPVHMSFALAKNVPLQHSDGRLIRNRNILAKDSWSQDGYYKGKMYSNCQKMRLTISRDKLLENGSTFKIAVSCKLHGNLSAVAEAQHNHAYPFSLVVRLRENRAPSRLSNLLYERIQAVNTLESITELEAELDA